MNGILETLKAVDWRSVLGTTPLEITATVCAVAGVFCIARQKILGWPLGLIWAGISTYLAFTQWNLVSDGILYASYVPIQVYCWILWARRGRPGAEAPFVPSWMSRRTQVVLATAAAVSIALWALGVKALAGAVSWIPEPSLLWLDSTTTVLNYYAQFLQARKRMENWMGWLIVNVLGIYIYWVKDSPVYSVQYAFFLGLGLYGWFQWRKTLATQTPSERSAP
jgi:nicotinamide mononucleotide transporter